MRELAERLAREPLIGVTAASKMLGMPPSNFTRDAKPRLTPVPVEGSADVYFRSQVEQLAGELAQRKARRAGAAPVAPAKRSRARASRNGVSSAKAKADVTPIPKARKRG